MNRARLLLTLPALVTLVLPVAMDLNPTHQLNEAWPPHARYHAAVLLSANVLAGLIALYLLWARRGAPGEGARLRTAALLPALIWGSFFPALLAPGGSTWPDGVAPPEGMPLPVAPNVIIAGVLVALCALGAWWARKAEPSGS
jgi:hypothetical protein